jgi:hypothetical protein
MAMSFHNAILVTRWKKVRMMMMETKCVFSQHHHTVKNNSKGFPRPNTFLLL